jgi:predicted Zn-dependent protease
MFSEDIKTGLADLVAVLREKITPAEQFVLRLEGEDSVFTRFNGGRVRQTGAVWDARYELSLFRDGKTCWRSFPSAGDGNRWQAAEILQELRSEIDQLPVDPYAVLPEAAHTSSHSQSGQFPTDPAAILAVTQGLDFTGLYACGTVVRGYADSAGCTHWFSTETFTLDYSLFDAEGRAVKGTYAGSQWDDQEYQSHIAAARQQLEKMQRPMKSIDRGPYRTYLAPAAVADLVGMMSWGGIGEAALQQGQSALAAMRDGRHLSPLLSLSEDFTGGLVPRFNDTGEIAPERLPLLESGKLVNTLVNARTAKEYGKESNGANGGESLRSPILATGNLAAQRILAELGTGLYLSNLHYLNWSDRTSGRITGMTRYACFWVEDGEIVAPISNLRFDASLYDFWGDNLLAVTDFAEYIAAVDSYGGRSLGGDLVPGMLIQDFTYTL